MAKAEMTAAVAALGLSMEVKFVPWSQSRNKGEDRPSLNWSVKILKGKRLIVETDYGAGYSHCPSAKGIGYKPTVDQMKRINQECETGRSNGKPILPLIEDVIYGLVSDADVLNYESFEEWAPNVGFDPDSRKGEKVYHACMRTALAIQTRLGQDGLKLLQEACQDY